MSFTVVDVPSDGNCLFSSLAMGAGTTHVVARQMSVAGVLSDNLLLAKALSGLGVADTQPLTKFQQIWTYMKTMLVPGTYGGEPEVAGFVLATGRPVCMHRAYGTVVYCTCHCQSEANHPDAIHIKHIGGSDEGHYMYLTKTTNDDDDVRISDLF